MADAATTTDKVVDTTATTTAADTTKTAATTAAATTGDKTAAATTATTAAATTDITGTDAATDKTVTAPADWPEDWRDRLAAGDEKLLGRLKRFAAPQNVLKSYLALEQRVSSGELKSALPKDAKPEEITAWRKENGIPEKAEAYLEKLPDGVVIGEQDKPAMAALAQQMHEVNAPPGVVSKVIEFYYKNQERAATARAEADATTWADTEDQLRAEYGGNYRGVINGIVGTLEGHLGKDVTAAILTARLGDGTKVGGNAAALKALAQLSQEINPAATVAPGSGTSAAASIADELTKLRGMMGDRKSAYWKGPDAAKNQARYRELVSAGERLKSRAA